MSFTRLPKQQRWILSFVAALFLVAQLGIATHSLHLDGGGKTEVVCGFCVTSHASMDGLAHAPTLRFSFAPSEVLSDGITVITSFEFPSSARVRAPPAC